MRCELSKPTRFTQIATTVVAAMSSMIPHELASAATTQEATTTNVQSVTSDVPTAQSIRDELHALLRSGQSLTLFSNRLRDSSLNDPATLAAAARVQIERGDLRGAISYLQKSIAAAPNDSLKRQLSYLQVAIGRNGDAESTLRSIIQAAHSPTDAVEPRLHLAMLLLDNGDVPEAMKSLDEAAEINSETAAVAGFIAELYGQHTAAARYLKAAPPNDISLMFLQGNAALAAGDLADAKTAFADSLRAATLSTDQRYAADRVIATARMSGSLPQLADGWLNDPQLSVDRLLPLATTLRELGRVSDLLAWWSRQAANPELASVMLSHRMVNELIGAARDANRGADAVKICQDLLTRQPNDPSWLEATARIELEVGRDAEADQLLRDRLTAAKSSPEKLESLGRLARSLGRNDVAMDAAADLEQLGGGNEVAGLLLASSVRVLSGDKPAAAPLLHQAAAIVATAPDLTQEVASGFESAGLDQDEIALLQSDPKLNDDHDVQLRLGTLLVVAHRAKEAEPLFDRLRKTADSESMRQQAAQRLIQLASADGTLPALISKLEGVSRAGRADASDVFLLMDAYLHEKQNDKAESLLKTTSVFDESSRLHQLCTLYLREHNAIEAEKLLKQLIALEPDSAVTRLEQLASLLLDQKQPTEAASVIDEVEKRTGSGTAAAEMLGGLYDRLNRPNESATQYRRALAVAGENADDWLLWASSMAKGGHAPEAIARLQVLANEANSDAVFAAAIDGMLNNDAPPGVLRAARLEAILRAAHERNSIALSHLLTDLSDELHDGQFAVRVAEASVAFSGDERSQTLRSLMERAAATGMVDRAVECGRSVLALGDDFPPEMFLLLGQQLLAAGRTPEAQRAFSRAEEMGSSDLVLPRVAELFDRYQYFNEGLRATSVMLARHPYDAAFHAAAGSDSEILGDAKGAFEQYLLALTPAIANLPASEPAALPNPRSYRRRVPAEEAFNQLVGSALSVARDEQTQSRLLKLLRDACERVTASSPDAGPNTDVTVLAAAVRRVAFTMGHPQAADEMDRALLTRWPDADVLKVAGFNDRWKSGLFTQAANFRETYHPPNLDEQFNLILAGSGLTKSESASGSAAAASQQTNMPADPSIAAAEKLPALIVQGQMEQAQALLNTVPPEQVRSNVAFPVLVAAAAALGDRADVCRFGNAWLTPPLNRAVLYVPPPGQSTFRGVTRITTTGATSTGLSDIQYARNIINALASVYTPEELVPLVTTLSNALHAAKSDMTASILADAELHTANASGVSIIKDLDVIGRWETAQPGSIPPNANQLFELSPATERSAVLEKIFPHIPPNLHLQFLLHLTAETTFAFDDATCKLIIATADKLPPGQSIDWCPWFSNDAQQSVLPALIAAVLRTTPAANSATGTSGTPVASATPAASNTPAPSNALANSATPDDPINLLMAAIAASRVNQISVADDAATRAFAVYSRYLPPPDSKSSQALSMQYGREGPQGSRIDRLRFAVYAMSPAARDKSLQSLRDSAANTSDSNSSEQTAWSEAATAIVYQGKGQREQALQKLRHAFEINPADQDIRAALADMLSEDGRRAEYLQRFGTGATSIAASSTLRENAIGDLQQLYRNAETWPLLSSSEEAPVLPPDFMKAAAEGDSAKSAEMVRLVLQSGRPTNTFWQSNVAAMNPGGLSTPFIDFASSDAAIRGLDNLDSSKSTPDDLLAAIDNFTPASSRFTGGRYAFQSFTKMIDVLLHAAGQDAQLRDRLLRTLEARAADQTMTGNQRALLQRLACLPGVHLSPTLLAELWKLATFDPNGQGTKALAQSLEAEQSPQAADVARWAQVAVWTERASVVPDLTTAIPINDEYGPFDRLQDRDLANVLQSQLDAGEAVTVEAELTRLRSTGRIQRGQIQLGLTWARCAAERGDASQFKGRLAEVFDLWGWQARASLFDLRLCFPKSLPHGKSGPLIDAAVELLDRVAGLWPASTNLTRYYALIGEWAFDIGDVDRATRIASLANQLGESQGVGEHHLWIADLLDKVGDHRRSEQYQLAMLEQRCLPAARIVRLLNLLNDEGSVAQAKKLALNAASYCQEPDLVKFLR